MDMRPLEYIVIAIVVRRVFNLDPEQQSHCPDRETWTRRAARPAGEY
jgi:hypothetical protein